MELLPWMAIPGFLIILAYVVTKMKAYYDARKEKIERELDRYNYLDCWLLHCVNKNHPNCLDFESERNMIRCRLKRRGIEV